MKVWLIHNNVPPYRVPLFTRIAESKAFDFSVVLTAPRCQSRPHWHMSPGEMPFPVLMMRGWNIRLSDARSLSISLGLFPALVRNRPDIVICGGFGFSTLLVFIYTCLFRKKYIIWSEATLTTERYRGAKGVKRWLRRVVSAHASAFIDAGTLAREYLQSLLPAKSRTPFFRAYNCVDESMFSSPDNHDPGEPSSLRRILFVGRLNENKGIPMLLDVYQDLLENCKDPVGLVLVGDGPLRDAVEEFRREHGCAHLEMPGQVPYHEVAVYYRSCSIFVLLSLSDCNPLVILEALHGGIPIVCTNRAGNAPDFIHPGENGYIVDPTDKEDIVRCVREVLGWNAQKRQNASRISQRLVGVANYSASAQAFADACLFVQRDAPSHIASPGVR